MIGAGLQLAARPGRYRSSTRSRGIRRGVEPAEDHTRPRGKPPGATTLSVADRQKVNTSPSEPSPWVTVEVPSLGQHP